MWMFLSFYFLIIFVWAMDQMIIYNEKCLTVMRNPQFHTLDRLCSLQIKKYTYKQAAALAVSVDKWLPFYPLFACFIFW